MTLNLNPGDYARDKDGNVYGPLDNGSFGRLWADGHGWNVDGSPIHEALPRLVAKVRPVTTYEDVPPEPVRETVRGTMQFRQNGTLIFSTRATVEAIDGNPDWSTLRVTE